MMNSLTLSKMRDSTINTICLSCHVTSSTTQFQCMTINMRTASTKTTFFKPILTLTNLDLIPSLSKNSFRLTILSKKEALIKKAPMWQKIVADASNGPTSPDPKFQSKEKSNLKVDDDTMVKAKLAERLKIGIYFAIWWSLNVVFNIYNKKVLNVYPFPWLTSTLSLAAGSAIMLVLWALKIVEAPKVDCDFLKDLVPVCLSIASCESLIKI